MHTIDVLEASKIISNYRTMILETLVYENNPQPNLDSIILYNLLTLISLRDMPYCDESNDT